MDAESLRAYWESVHAAALERRLWFETLYADVFRGKRVLDVGCGLAISTLHFATHGAKLTFLDIVEDNVEIVRRLCRIKGIDAEFCFAEDLTAFSALGEYDVVSAAAQ